MVGSASGPGSTFKVFLGSARVRVPLSNKIRVRVGSVHHIYGSLRVRVRIFGPVKTSNVEIPPVERTIAMQLCPQGTAAWRGNPRLPSRACKFSSALTAKAYSAAGQAASALHAMALLQVHQAKALKQLHEGGADPGGLQELRTATDLALWATKVTGQTMSTLVVQERHLWLTLADMRESDKHRFLDARSPRPAYSAKRWRALPNSSPPHSSRRRRFDISCPGGPLLSPPHRRLQPLCLLVAEGALLRPPPPLQLGLSSSLHNGRSMELAAGKRRSPPPPLPSP